MTYKRGWSIDCLLRWLRVREEAGHPFPQSLRQLEADIAHSALLTRLLEGKDPLPEPPPRAMAYPWYELIEKGRAEAYEVFELTGGVEEGSGYQVLVVDQYPWKIVKKVSEDEYLVTYDEGKTQWKAYAVVVEESIDADMDAPPEILTSRGRIVKKWIIERA